MIHKMRLNEVPFEKICSGMKTVELRLNDEKRRMIKIGDTIEFENRSYPEKHVSAAVKNIRSFRDFKELYSVISLQKCGYSAEELGKASPDDMLEYYSAEEQKKYGVVGIEIELCGTKK